MIVYLLIGILILVFGLVFEKKIKYKLFYCFFISAILIFFSALRGDFTSDYFSYISFFDYVKGLDFAYIWNNSFYNEKGFVFLNKILSLISTNNLVIIIFMSILTILSFCFKLKKHSPTLWLSILIFVSIGNFYDSFNVSRQIMAASIVFLGSDYLFEGKFFKYSIFVLIAALFHRTAILMIPLYFLIRIKISFKNIILLIVLGTAAFFALPQLILLAQRIFPSYQDYSYGMSGGNFKWLIAPISLLIFVIYSIVFKRANSFVINDGINNVLMNCLIIYVIFTIFGMQVPMITRISTYLQPFSWILIPKLLSCYDNKKEGFFITSAIALLCLVYPLVVLSGTGYDPYYFCWRNR